MVNNPLRLLWVGRATVYSYQTITDEVTKESKLSKVVSIQNEPCRVSYESQTQNQMIGVGNGVTNIDKRITLFIRPDLSIPAGSVIEVVQNNRTTKYKRSTEPSVYTNHQEIGLELYEDQS